MATAALAARQERERRGILYALAATFFWSLSGVMVRLLDQAVGWQIVLYRSIGMVVTITLLVAAMHRGRVLDAIRAAGWSGFFAGMFTALASMFFILALGYTTVANALFMSGIAPFITAILARYFLAEHIPPITWLGAALSAFGLAIMVGGGLQLGQITGTVLALGSAVSFSLFCFTLRRGRQIDMLPSLIHSGLFSIAVSTVLLLALDSPAAFVLTPHDLVLCIALGVVQLGLGTVLFTLGVRDVPATRMQVLATMELVLSPFWAFLVVGEVPAGATLVGGAFILLATALQAKASIRLPPEGPV